MEIEKINFFIEAIIRQLNFNLAYAKKLVEDVSETDFTFKVHAGLENHPAFTLGHLVTGAALMVEDLGGIYEVPEGWKELFQRKGPGDPRLPEDDSTLYPSKEKLLLEFERQHQKLIDILRSIEEEKLFGEIIWRFNKYFPSLYDLTLFMCTSHEVMHLGQLSAWRRAMKLPSALAAL